VITLDVADLVVIAGQTLGIGTDAALGQLDVAAAQAALTEARLTGRAITDQDTAAVAGIRLMHALLRHRPFALHGERVAVAAGLQFLSLNGWRADLDPPATAAVVVEALACGQLSPVSAAAWLR
jgi:prophage maintenance system killer protein